MDIRKSFRFYKFLNALCLNIVSMTCLKCHFYYTLDIILFKESSHQFNTVVIWCHNGTSDCKISLCNCFVDVLCIFIDETVNRFCTSTVFIDYNISTVFFDGFDNLGAPLLGHPVKRIRFFLSGFSPSSYSFISFSRRASISAGIFSLSNLNWLP